MMPRAGAKGESPAAEQSLVSGGRQPVSVKQNLEAQLAEQANLIRELKERRLQDLERLREVTRSRDLLEGRLAADAAKVAESLERLAEKEKLLGQLNEVAGAASFLRKSEHDEESPSVARPRRWLAWAGHKLWWRYTLRAAHRAQRAGQLAQAQILFEAALLTREHAPTLTQLAHILRERQLFDVAQAAYERALELDPTSAENMFLAGYCAEMAGRKQEAERHYDAAKTKDPGLESRYDHLRGYGQRLFG